MSGDGGGEVVAEQGFLRGAQVKRRGPIGGAAELEMFNNDLRLRALRTLAESLTLIEQKKAIVYFSAGMQRSDQVRSWVRMFTFVEDRLGLPAQ